LGADGKGTGIFMILLILAAAIGLSIVMMLAWAYQRRVNNAGWVDVFWTAGLGLAGVAMALAPIPGASGPTERQGLIALMVAVWAIRLGSYLGIRVAHSAEDVRYNNFRKVWGDDFQRRMFWFLQVQAAASVLLAICILLAARHPASGIRPVDWAGVAILAIAIVGEAIADNQLKRFKADPANTGGICNVGLWRWSRHPNYFFEWLVWTAYLIMAADFTGAYWWGWFALIGPVSMYYLLVCVSGIPPLENLMLKSRGDAYRRYQAVTSAFFPLPPRRHPNDGETDNP
jgi:steroid 5-alpha reductase family enzyme